MLPRFTTFVAMKAGRVSKTRKAVGRTLTRFLREASALPTLNGLFSTNVVKERAHYGSPGRTND